jgi:uncharacterized membrane protein YsdA (DUF1294 family)
VSLILLAIAAVYFLGVNYMALQAFYVDKRSAIAGEWRTPEAELLFLTFMGGSPGTKLAQRLFRHKTRKQPFAGTLNAIVAFHLAVTGLFFVPSVPHALAQGIGGLTAALVQKDVRVNERPRSAMPTRFGPSSNGAWRGRKGASF